VYCLKTPSPILFVDMPTSPLPPNSDISEFGTKSGPKSEASDFGWGEGTICTIALAENPNNNRTLLHYAHPLTGMHRIRGTAHS
jgi:hypothetical protein